MKKYGILLAMVLCLFMTGCSNGFAEKEYDSIEKIANNEDRYAKENSVFNPIDGGYSLVVSKFDGRQTLWTDTSTDGYVTKTISMPGGQNKLKIVGFDCENIDLKMLFSISR